MSSLPDVVHRIVYNPTELGTAARRIDDSVDTLLARRTRRRGHIPAPRASAEPTLGEGGPA
jgi:hypothetical protein